jgi:HK97 gp10 family phage protein
VSEIHIKGGRELQKFLDTLPARLEANIMRSALRQGAKVVLEEAKQNVPVQDGKLRDSLKVSTRMRKGVATASVRSKLFYSRFVEYGTKPHTIAAKKGGWLSFGGFFAKSVEHPGATAKAFMRPALDSQAQEALNAVAQQIRKRLTKEGLNTSDILLEGDE